MRIDCPSMSDVMEGQFSSSLPTQDTLASVFNHNNNNNNNSNHLFLYASSLSGNDSQFSALP